MPGPDWVRWVAAMYANLRAGKERKKAGEQEAEDREWQELLRPLQQRNVEADIAQSEAATKASLATTKRTEATPIAKQYAAPRGALITAAKALGYDISDVDSWEPDFQQQVIEGHKAILLRQTETAAQSKLLDKAEKTRIEGMKKEYRSKKTDLEKRYGKALSDIEEKYRAETANARVKQSQLLQTEDPTAPNPYLISLKGALSSKKRALKLLEQVKQDELDKLSQEYYEIMPDSMRTSRAPASPAKATATGNQDVDEYGFVLDEVKDFPEGPHKYIGNNQWIPVK